MKLKIKFDGFKIIQKLISMKQDGILSFSYPYGNIYFLFRNEMLLKCWSDILHLTLPAFMIKTRILSEAMVSDAIKQAGEKKKTFQQLLVEKKLLTDDDLKRSDHALSQNLLDSIILAEEGEVSFKKGDFTEIPAEDTEEMDIYESLFRSLSTFKDMHFLKDFFEYTKIRNYARSSLYNDHITLLFYFFKDAQTVIDTIFDGNDKIQNPEESLEFLQVYTGLVLSGMIAEEDRKSTLILDGTFFSFKSEEPEAGPAEVAGDETAEVTETAKPETGMEPAVFPAETEQIEEESHAVLKTVNQDLQLLSERNCFEILEVTIDSSLSFIRSQFQRLKLKYAAEKFENFITDPSQMEILKNINSLINKAFTVLTDPKLRIAYYRKLDIFSREVESKLLQMFEAEKIFEEGIYQFNGEKFDDSLNSFERAAALNPNEPEYSVWIGKSCFVLFLKDPQKNESLLNKAESLVNDALGKNPELVEGLLFKTSLLLHRERRDEAMSMVRQILKINPRHTEAKKIYRMISEKSAVKEAEKAIPEKKESFFEKIQSKLKKEVSKWLEKQKRTS